MIQSAGELKLSLRYEPPEDDEGKKKKQGNGHLHVHVYAHVIILKVLSYFEPKEASIQKPNSILVLILSR